ncbi:MAG: DUF503 family protein [bacterium]|nr:DUF503 family protein [bacterium]
MDDIRVTTGMLVLDLRLPHATSLKERRQELRSLMDRLRRQEFAAAQVGPADLQQRAFVAVAAVAGAPAQLEERLDQAEALAFGTAFEVAVLRRETGAWSGRSLW